MRAHRGSSEGGAPRTEGANPPFACLSREPWSTAALAVLAFLTVVYLIYDSWLASLMWKFNMNDFGKFYFSGRCILEGCDPYTSVNPATLLPVSDAEFIFLPNMNPPHFHLPILPLSAMPPAAATVAWALVSLAALFMSVRVWLANCGPLRLDGARLYIALWAAVAFVGTSSIIATGQLSWLLLWPVTQTWTDMRNGRWTRAGLLLGVLCGVKPFLAMLLLYPALLGQYRAIAASLLAIGCSFGLGIAVFGIDAHVSWLKALRSVDWGWAAMNASLPGFVARITTVTRDFVPLIAGAAWGSALSACGVVALLLATVVVLRRQTVGPDHAFLALVSLSLLASPLGWVYYFWFLLPPFFALFKGGFGIRNRVLLAPVLVAAVWPAALSTLGQPSPCATVTVGSMYFWGLALLWFATIMDAKSLEETPARQSLAEGAKAYA